MEDYKVIEIKASVFENNDKEAQKVREGLKEENTFLLNLMSSPGSGKTTTLMETIKRLKDEMKIGIMEADIDSAVDAETISTTGGKTSQLHRRHVSSGCRNDKTRTRRIGNERLRYGCLRKCGKPGLSG